MTEREIAENICRAMARNLVDENGGFSMGGTTLAEKYSERQFKAGYDIQMIAKHANALRHWVVAAGYDLDNSFRVVLSNNILNK